MGAPVVLTLAMRCRCLNEVGERSRERRSSSVLVRGRLLLYESWPLWAAWELSPLPCVLLRPSIPRPFAALAALVRLPGLLLPESNSLSRLRRVLRLLVGLFDLVACAARPPVMVVVLTGTNACSKLVVPRPESTSSGVTALMVVPLGAGDAVSPIPRDAWTWAFCACACAWAWARASRCAALLAFSSESHSSYRLGSFLRRGSVQCCLSRPLAMLAPCPVCTMLRALCDAAHCSRFQLFGRPS